MKNNIDYKDKAIIFVPSLREGVALFGDNFHQDRDGFLVNTWNNILVVVTGIGKVNCAITLTKFLCYYGTGFYPVLVGICGAYRYSKARVGDLYMVDKDYFVDEALYRKSGIIYTEEIGFPITEGHYTEFCTLDINIKKTDANTVSLLSSEDDLATLYYNKSMASIETMEGAAFGLVVKQHGMKAMQLRAVSNYCGDRDNQQWDAKKAIINLRHGLNKLF